MSKRIANKNPTDAEVVKNLLDNGPLMAREEWTKDEIYKWCNQLYNQLEQTRSWIIEKLVTSVVILFCLASLSLGATIEDQMVARINAERAAYGKPPLVVDDSLMRCAQHRVQWYNHFAEGCGVEVSAHRYGFRGPATDDLAQDDGSGMWSVSEMVHGWVLSFGHRQQLLGRINLNNRWVEMNFNCVGVAHRGRNWIAIFGRKDK